ncbi:MAG TPA: hypothetical protein VKK79_25030, partial [Candidatus Lokiarchaeia archaeon]|nr:hypothetical protein [Candidatus Lokiarchaeia archaeon]
MDSFTVVISPHWHFDHAWIKTHEQYMDELVVPNFRLLLHLLQKYPTYKCAVEQATQWISLRRIAPDVFQALTTFVEQGRIALVGGQVTSPD